jgi:hypothetical protein
MYKGAYTHIYWYFRWNGTSWYKRPLLNSGATMGAQNEFAGGITLDHENPDVVYISRQMVKPGATVFNLLDTSFKNYKDSLTTASYVITDSVHELDKWTTSDGGKTWDSIAITRNSTNKNCRPCVPRGHKESMNLNVIWLNGTYTSMGGSGFSMAVRLYPTERSVGAVVPSAGDVFLKPNISYNNSGLFIDIKEPSEAMLRLYSANGRLLADYSSKVRSLKQGNSFISVPWEQYPGGMLLMSFSDGKHFSTMKIICFHQR